VTKPSLSSRDTSRQEGAAPKGCSLGFVYFLKNGDRFLVHEHVSALHSGMSRRLSSPRPSRTERPHAELRVTMSPPAAPAPAASLPPSPQRSAAAEQTPRTAKPAADTSTSKGDQTAQRHSPGTGHSKLSPLWPLGHRLKPPSSQCPGHQSQTAYIFSEPIYLFWD